jgi:hypothetical protein
MAQVTEHLSSKHEVLDSYSSNTKKKKRRRKTKTLYYMRILNTLLYENIKHSTI